MMKKVLLVAFQGQEMCFIHVLLNGIQLQGEGHDCKIIIEGEATKLIPQVVRKDHFLNELYNRVVAEGLIEGVCRACSSKMEVLKQIEKEGLPLLDDMSGHPGMAKYIEQGYAVINF